MSGGLAKSTSWWELGSKTWRAPDPLQQLEDRNARLMREAEERRIKEVRHRAIRLAENHQLEHRSQQINSLALNVELSAQRHHHNHNHYPSLYRRRSVGSLAIEGERQRMLMMRQREMEMRALGEMRGERARMERRRLEEELLMRNRRISNVALAQQQQRLSTTAYLPAPSNYLGIGGPLPRAAVRPRPVSFHGVLPARRLAIEGAYPPEYNFKNGGGFPPRGGMGGGGAPIVNYTTYNLPAPQPPRVEPTYEFGPHLAPPHHHANHPNYDPYPDQTFLQDQHYYDNDGRGRGGLGARMPYDYPDEGRSSALTITGGPSFSNHPQQHHYPEDSNYLDPLIHRGDHGSIDHHNNFLSPLAGVSGSGAFEPDPLSQHAPQELQFSITDSPQPDDPQLRVLQSLGEIRGIAPTVGGGGMGEGGGGDPMNDAVQEVIRVAQGMGANGILSLSVNEELEGMIATGEAVILG